VEAKQSSFKAKYKKIKIAMSNKYGDSPNIPNSHHNIHDKHDNRHLINIHNLNKLVQETAARVAESNVVSIPHKDSKQLKSKVSIYTKQKLRASNVVSVFGIIGLLLMVLDNEFIIAEVYSLVMTP
jgi:hypothetical protein